VFIKDERVSLPEILSAYTINGAYLGHWEKECGSLEVGKSADLLILDKNLFAVSPFEIHNSKVLWTVFKGRVVYKDPNFEI
ncbi:MAG: amidohydrolase family protein, partial [Candidatus Obscuribacterales bacterium]|nr:amidohydrolase family protein [Candidatus Obscuribacterales bacterium]